MCHYNKSIMFTLALLILVSSAVGAEMNNSTSGSRESIVLGMGCFWGAEKRMAALPGVVDVISGYAGGSYANPTYQKILSSEGRKDVTNHAEVVKVIFDPAKTSIEQVLIGFWENHNPTQGNRQGNDVGSNYRSAIFYSSDSQRSAALKTRDIYQQALTAAGFGAITTEIAPLNSFNKAEEYHQDYLKKNPRGYCGIGGTNVRFPAYMSRDADAVTAVQPLDPAELSHKEQLIVFESEECQFCKLFKDQVLSNWNSDLPIATTFSTQPPAGWTLEKELWATPTIVLFRYGKEVNRYTGYNGEDKRFWKWLGYSTLSEEEISIAYENGTEPAFSGSLLDNRESGTYVDPVTGEPLFSSDSKFKSGTGWPSFFQPIAGAVTLHEDNGFFSRRVEVRSASSGIHLGHVFDDGPRPTGKRYCINSKVLRFVPDEEK